MSDTVALYDLTAEASNRDPRLVSSFPVPANPDPSPVPDISWLARVAD